MPLQTFELRPEIKTTVKNDLSATAGAKQGEQVKLTRGTIDGARARFGSSRYYLSLDEYNLSEDQLRSFKRQAEEAKRDLVMSPKALVFRREPKHYQRQY